LSPSIDVGTEIVVNAAREESVVIVDVQSLSLEVTRDLRGALWTWSAGLSCIILFPSIVLM
jgi:hypothetical protein